MRNNIMYHVITIRNSVYASFENVLAEYIASYVHCSVRIGLIVHHASSFLS